MKKLKELGAGGPPAQVGCTAGGPCPAKGMRRTPDQWRCGCIASLPHSCTAPLGVSPCRTPWRAAGNECGPPAEGKERRNQGELKVMRLLRSTAKVGTIRDGAELLGNATWYMVHHLKCCLQPTSLHCG